MIVLDLVGTRIEYVRSHFDGIVQIPMTIRNPGHQRSQLEYRTRLDRVTVGHLVPFSVGFPFLVTNQINHGPYFAGTGFQQDGATQSSLVGFHGFDK